MKDFVKSILLIIVVTFATIAFSSCVGRMALSDEEWDYYEMQNSHNDDIDMLNSEIDMDDVYHD